MDIPPAPTNTHLNSHTQHRNEQLNPIQVMQKHIRFSLRGLTLIRRRLPSVCLLASRLRELRTP
jgi:hypothetical protein